MRGIPSRVADPTVADTTIRVRPRCPLVRARRGLKAPRPRSPPAGPGVRDERARGSNSIDDPDTQAEKWNSVLQEPENAKLLSELGLLTIPEYEIMVATINGRELPALSMTPFSDPSKIGRASCRERV